MTTPRPRVAYFSPLRPDPSGISDYSEELLPFLRRYWRVELFVDGYRPTAAAARGLPVVDCAERDPLPLLPAYDAVLYHMGNSASHRYVLRTLRRWPGVVVVHDFSLHHLLVEETIKQGRPDHYAAEIRARYGDAGAERVRRSFYGDEPRIWVSDALAYPWNEEVLDRATAVVVHSLFLEERVRALRPGLLVRRIEHHAEPPPPDVRASLRRGCPPDTCVFATAGYLTPSKQITLVLDALARLRGRFPFEYHLTGEVALPAELRFEIRDRRLADVTVLRGRTTKHDLYRALLEADVCICLRHPTMGETSGIVMRALACGRPVVVSDLGWFAELPDDAVVKIPMHDEAESVAALVEALEGLARSPERRFRMGEAGRAYANARDPHTRAWEYDALVREAGAFPGRRVGRAFLDASTRLRELGWSDPAPIAFEAASRLAELLRVPAPEMLPDLGEEEPREEDAPEDATRGEEPRC